LISIFFPCLWKPFLGDLINDLEKKSFRNFN
jgi:hypothetical protein